MVPINPKELAALSVAAAVAIVECCPEDADVIAALLMTISDQIALLMITSKKEDKTGVPTLI